MKGHPLDRERLVSVAVVFFVVIVLTIVVKHSASSQTNALAGLLEDPHYRVILENSQVRVFAVTIRPHQQAFVRSPHNVLTVTLEDSQLAIWSDDQPIPAAPLNVKELLIAVTESELVKRDGERIHEVPGGVVWMETRTDALINDTTDSERLVIIEMR